MQESEKLPPVVPNNGANILKRRPFSTSSSNIIQARSKTPLPTNGRKSHLITHNFSVNDVFTELKEVDFVNELWK